jgi:hypothetical protein
MSQHYEDWIFFVDTKLERYGEDCVCATNEEQELQDKLNERSNVLDESKSRSQRHDPNDRICLYHATNIDPSRCVLRPVPNRIVR